MNNNILTNGRTKRKKNYKKIGVIAIIVIVAIWLVSSYNGFVDKEEQCNSQWSKVQVQYQRRLDLIPTL